MGRLYRPHIPLAVRVQVAERQAKEQPTLRFGAYWYVRNNLTFRHRLDCLLEILAQRFRCEMSDLRLDHDPPLGARQRLQYSSVVKPIYIPHANDPEHLKYRPHGPQFDGSHLIKTNVRGDHGQHPDRVLIKKQRRIERGPKPKRGPKIQSRGFAKPPAGKTKWPKRPLGREK
jgi:hypothetical protein